MKSKLLIALVMIFAMTSLSACGENNIKLDKNKPITITLWHYYQGAQKNSFDNLVSEFNETVGMDNGIIISATGQGNVSDLINNVIASAENKVGTEKIPNIFAAYPDTAYQIDELGLIAELEDYLTEDEIEEYIPSFIDEGRFGDEQKLKIFPTAKSTEVFMLNKTDWEPFANDTQIDVSKLETIEGVIEIAKAYYEWTDAKTPDVPDDGKAFFGRDSMANYFIIGSLQLGTELFDIDDDGKSIINADKDVFRKLWDSYYIPFINGYFAANGRFRSDDAKVGDIIALVGSSTSVSYFPPQVILPDSTSYPVELLLLEAPAFENGEGYAVQQGAGMAVTTATPEEEYASVMFLKWFTEADRNIRFSTDSGYMPVKISANDKEKLAEAFAEKERDEFTDSMEKGLNVALETIQTKQLYTSKGFHGGTDARNILGDVLENKAKEDAATVNEMVAGGMRRSDAAETFNTDENFNAWYDDVVSQLHATQNED